MAEFAHSIPASDVHSLDGSSAPSAASLDFSAIAEMPGAFVPLGLAVADVVAGLARRRQQQSPPDAEVIDLAGRVAALAMRQERLLDRHVTLQSRFDEWDFANRPKAPALVPAGSQMVMTDLSTTTHRVMQFAEPLDADKVQAPLDAAYVAACHAHGRRAARKLARSRAPYLLKISDRMYRRLVRRATRLTEMEPATQAGLKAKAEAQIAVEDAGNEDWWTANLASAVGHDAVRIITAEADWAYADDAELLPLIAQHAPALARWTAADEASDLVRDVYRKVEPVRPAALYGRLSDGTFPRNGLEAIEGSTSRRTYYTDNDVRKLRAAPEPMMPSTGRADSPEGTGLAWRPDPRSIARRTEILTAWDAWEDEKAALRESTGLNAANALCDAVGVELSRIEDTIFDLTPSTFEGLQAKARWIASTPMAKERAVHLMHDLCRMPSIAVAPPVQVAPSREVVETYRTFLDMEFRFLNWETHRHPEAIGGIWLDNPAGQLHGGDGPPPSSRAIAVLTTLGLMPATSVEEKRIDEARAA